MSTPNTLQGSRPTQDIAHGKTRQFLLIAAFSGELVHGYQRGKRSRFIVSGFETAVLASLQQGFPSGANHPDV
jgi:hypothetical protein